MRDEQKNYTRERLLDSAAQILAERGLAEATVGEIADLANASRATFYLHFKDKEDLILALLDKVQPDVAAFYSRLDDVIEDGDPEAFRSWVVDALRWFAENESTVMVLEHALISKRGFAANILPNYTTYMPKYVARWPSSERREADLRVWLIVQVLARINVAWRFGHSFTDFDEAQMADIISDIFGHTLRLTTLD